MWAWKRHRRNARRKERGKLDPDLAFYGVPAVEPILSPLERADMRAQRRGMRPLIDEDLGSRMLYHMAACTIDCSRRHVADGPFVAVSGSVAHMRDAWICWMWGIVILALQSFRFHTQYTRYVRVRHTHVTTLSGRSCLCQRKGGVCTTSASGGAEAEWRGATRGALLRADSSRALCP